MFDSNKKYTVGVYDLSFMLIDEEDNILSHPDGRTMEFTIPNYDCSYLGDGVEVNDLVLRQPNLTQNQSNPTQKWTHDFSFVFTVNTHQSDPDKISPEIIVDRFMDTVQNMSREEIFERSECYNSFAEELDNENDKERKQKKTDWIIVYSSDYEEWQVSDGPVGNRGCSYDFKTKEEAEQFLKELRQDDCNSKTNAGD